MNEMKKLLLLGAVALVPFALTGCGTEPTTPVEPEEVVGAIETPIDEIGVPNENDISNVEVFNAEGNPIPAGITDETVYLPEGQTPEEIPTVSAGDEVIEIVGWWDVWGEYEILSEDILLVAEEAIPVD